MLCSYIEGEFVSSFNGGTQVWKKHLGINHKSNKIHFPIKINFIEKLGSQKNTKRKKESIVLPSKHVLYMLTHTWKFWYICLQYFSYTLLLKNIVEIIIMSSLVFSLHYTMSAYYIITNFWGFPGGSDGKESAAVQETQVQSLGQEDPLQNATYSSILTEKFHGQKSLTGYSPWGHKESDMTEHGNPVSAVYILTNFSFILKFLIYFKYQWSLCTSSVQFSCSLCTTLCNSMNCSTPGFPVHHQLPELAQIHVHWVSDAIQPSHPLLSSSPPAFNLSQHQGQWVSSSHQVAKVLEFQLQHQSFQWIFRTDFL